MRFSLRTTALLLIGLFPIAGLRVAAQEANLDTERIQRATVFIMQTRNIGDDLIVICTGSGTLVSRDGLILTNAHNVVTSTTCSGDTLIVALSVRLGEPPVPKYRAEISQADPGLDLALLRITRELDGRLVEPSSLTLPFVELADSSAARLDQTLTVAGYPGIGNDPVTLVRGTITGFVAEPRDPDSAWIKTSAVIPGTMSGGGAYDQDGRLIGIPTTAPLVTQAQTVTCLPIQDTNRDGLVNSSDICIPIGGFINALRPSSFARPLLRAGSLGLQVETLSAPSAESVPDGQPTFTRLFFSPSVNEAGMPTSVVSSLPSGSNSLYLFFDYDNMTPDTIYELRVTTDGIPNPVFSLSPVRWSGGERGLWYIGSSGQPWSPGVYEFTLFANGVAAPARRLIVGEASQTLPVFSDIVFGLLDLRNNPLGNGYVLPTGNIASARFIYRNMENGMDWTAIWYLNGTEFSRSSNTWSDGPAGSTTTSIQSDAGLPPGSYRLELYIGDRLATTSDFIIAGAQQGAFPQVFTGERFVAASVPQDALTAPAISSFPSALATLYAVFDWQQIAPGTLWTLRWTVDGEVFYEQTAPWTGSESGQGFLMRLSNPVRLSDGTYGFELFLNNVRLVSAQAQVGIGQLPIDRFARASGVLLRGQILDADTRQGIPGVSFIVISEDFSVSDFSEMWSQNQVYAFAVTDSSGRFEIDRPLEFSTEDTPVLYSALITAEGYLPIAADGIEVTAETPNPLDLVIYLTRD